MGIFNKAIPKYTRNLIDNSLVVEPVEEPVTVVDDVYDPILNKAVRERLMSTYGNPIGATLGGYYELINNAFMGNKQQGGTMLPGIGVLSSFGRSMDKTGDVILGTLTEATKGLTGQGVESPLYNIFTEDEDYSGQRYLAAAANSMAKLANAPTLTEDDFGGVWTIPALGIDLATDPSILGGNLTKIAKGQGAVAEAGEILKQYDDIMSKVAIDATAPGLRPLGKKFGAKMNSYLSNLRSEKDLQDAILYVNETLDKYVVELENGNMSPDEFKNVLQKALNYVDSFKKVADEDVVAKPFKEMSEEVTKATQTSPPISSFRDEYAFLSNMFESPITIDGITYRNAEAAFQAGKLDDSNLRTQFSNLSGVDAKKLGKKVKLRKDWDKYKVEHMRNVLKAKFEQNPDLMQMLQDTGNSPLIEGNDWGDYFWGVVTDKYGYSEGGNVLGNLLEEVRGTLSKPDPSPYGRFRTRLNRLIKYAEMDSIAKQTGLKLDESLDINRQAINEIIDLMDKSMPFDTVRKSFVELYKDNPELMLKDLGVYSYQDTVNKATSRVPSNEELQALHAQIQEDSVKRAALRQGLKSKGQILTDSAIETYGRNAPLPQGVIDSIKKDIETLKKPASYTVGDYTPKSELLDSTKSKGFSSEENTEYFLSKLPSSFVDKYNITNQKDLIKMLQTNDPEELADLEYLFEQLVQKEGYISDSLKVSQSMSKLNPEVQIRIANNIQHLMSNILTEAVNKGLVSAKDISENTLDDLFNEIYDTIWAYERTGDKTIDSYRAFSKYSYNKDYLKQKLRQPALKVWHDVYLYDDPMPFMNKNGDIEWIEVPLTKKYPDTNAYYHMKDTRLQDTYGTFDKYLDSLVAGVRKQIAEFETEGANRLNSSEIVDDFLNKNVLVDKDGKTVLTFKDLANKMVEDEYNGKIPIQPRKRRFENISSRTGVEASKMIEEFQEFYNLVGAYQYKGGLLKYPIPAKLAKYTYTSEDLAKLQEMPKLKKGISRTKDLDDFMQYIQDVVKNYEININSKIAGRLPDDKFVKYVEYDRSNEFEDIIKPYLDSKAMSKLGKTTSENTIGYSNAINKILQRVNFNDLTDVYNLMHRRFKTSKGTFSLAELGFEVNRLPKTMSNKLKSSLEYGLTKPVKVGNKEMSFIDYISKKVPKTIGSYNIKLESPDDFAKYVISEQNYNDTFMQPLNIGWKTMWSHMKDTDLGALVRKPDISLYPVETEATKFAGISKDMLYKTFEDDYFAKQREQLLTNLSNPDKYYKNLLNRFVVTKTDPKLHYLNRLRSDLGTTTFENIQSIIKDSKDLGKVTKEINLPLSKKLARFDEMYEESITKTIEELPNEAFEQVVTNQWKIYQEADFEKRAEMINNMFPDQSPITAAELKLYEEYGGNGGKSPVIRKIQEVHKRPIRLYNLLSKEFKNSIIAKQDRNSVLGNDTISKLVDKASELQNIAGNDVHKVLTLLDKQKGSVVKGSNMLIDLITAGGRKIIAFEDKITGNLSDVAQMKEVANAIKHNMDIINKAVGGEVIKPINVVNTFGQREIGYQLVGNQKLLKKLHKIHAELPLKDIVFEKPTALTDSELKILDKYSPIVEHLNNVQKQASDYYTKIGFEFNDQGFFKHTFKNTPNWQKFVGDHYYKGIDYKHSEELASMCLDLGYFGNLKGQFGTLPNSRIFEGRIDRYNGIFETDLERITKGTFTKGVFANEKFQTTMSLFDNSEFRLNTYCKNIDDIKNILNSETNKTNLTIASIKYDSNGMISGFKKYDNFSDSSLTKALQDSEAIFLPTHIFSTLDKFCKQKSRMSNKAYAFINRYLVAPFKIGILLNPGFILGNMNDAYLKQAVTLSKKYGTSMAEELANVASSVKTTIHLNNKFSDIYDKYLSDLADYGVEISEINKISSQVAKSKSARDMFIKYLNGTLEYSYDDATKTASFVQSSLDETEEGIAKVWIHLNAVQPTEGITQELADSISGSSKSAISLNYARNPIDRILYGLRHYKGKDITTYGALNNPISKTYFGISEGTESLARSSTILNDLRHQGIDLNEFARLLNETDSSEFNVKMINAINTMHNANFDYNASAPILESLESFIPFPTFWLKNVSYWFDMFINHPQYIDTILDINEGLWANEDTEDDEFKADAKARGAIPLSAVSEPSGQKLSKFFRGIYKPSPFQSLFSAASALNNPIETTVQRTHPVIQGGIQLAGKIPPLNNLTTNLQNPEDVRYRPYNTNQYQPNIDSTEEEFNPLAYTFHKLNPLDRTLNTGLRTPGKIKKGEVQLSDFLPSVFQPDFSKK